MDLMTNQYLRIRNSSNIVSHTWILILIVIAVTGLQASASSLRHITTADGLSNMSVTSLTIDRDGRVWAGTCDGVNLIENNGIKAFAAGNNGKNEFSGNLIENIRQDSAGNLWVHTNYGLDHLDTKTGEIRYYREFKGRYYDALQPDGSLAVMAQGDSIYYYTPQSGTFRNLGNAPVNVGWIRAFTMDARHTLWLTTGDAVMMAKIDDEGKPLEFKTLFTDDIRNVCVAGDSLFLVLRNGNLDVIDLSSHRRSHITDIMPVMLRHGGVSAIVADGDDYILGFKREGAVRLRKNGADYEAIPYPFKSAVFSLVKDKKQDVIWFGTDGEGVYYQVSGPYSFYSQTTAGHGNSFSKPIRSLLVDREGSLWCGTKGDGLFRFRNFKPGGTNNDVVHYTSTENTLRNNDVYALAHSCRDLIWIGTQEIGLSYYSYADKTIHTLPVEEMPRLQSVHAIHESNPNELWVVTLGEGVFRLTIGGTQSRPEVTGVDEVIYDRNDSDANAFFSILQQNDSIFWFGNRGKGAYRYNRITHRTDIIDFSANGKAVANDVFSIAAPSATADTVYCATSDGLYRVFPLKEGGFGYDAVATHDRNPVRSIHALLNGGESNIIGSTNFGLADYHLPDMSYLFYSSGTDFEVRQFSDGAAYRDPSTGILYFGGTNGFVALTPTDFKWSEYTPDVIFGSLLIDNTPATLSQYLDSKGRLVLPHDKNTFAITFEATDYRIGYQFIYRYRLKGASDQWIETFTDNVAFTNMSPGHYTLEVEYNNGREWSRPYPLELIVKPPFYLSTTAMVIYAILLLLFIILLIIITVRIQHRKQREIVKTMEQKRKEDVYEAKLKFFTNITHELFTPLTLITGACERMMDDASLSKQNRRLTSTIHRNSTRLTELIQELIEFRRIDAEYRKPDVEEIDVSTMTEEIADNFTVLAEKKRIKLDTRIEPAIVWPTDRNGFVTIVTNLMSNAMKYTPDEGDISLCLSSENDKIVLTVTNSGEGIQPENLSQIFDRYKVLERFERLSDAGRIKRNGLGLAVCEGLTRLLDGSIRVESAPGEWTRFTVELPRIAVTRDKPSDSTVHYRKLIEMPSPEDDNDMEPRPAPESRDKDSAAEKPLVFVVDDNKEMLNFLSDSLADSYRVATFLSAEEAQDALQQQWPALIVCDIVMEGMSGVEFAHAVKSDKRTQHIPFVQLSSLHSEEEKVKALEAGADVYVTKPFNISYLTAVIGRMLKRKQNLKEYFDSSISSFDKVNGQMLHNDDQEFLQRMLKLIEENLTNPQLTTNFVADALGLSVRNLYRRLEGITDQTPTVIIKEMRLSTARNLLTHTNLSIEEIIYRVGFNNRGTFFKVFQQKFGCTPKQYRDNQVASIKSESDSVTEVSPEE